MCIAAVVVGVTVVPVIGPRRAVTANTGGEATIANASFCCGAELVHAPTEPTHSLLPAWDTARRFLHVERHCLGRVEAEAEQNKHNVRGEHHVGQQRRRMHRS